MTKMQSGCLIMAIAFFINALGRVLMAVMGQSHDVTLAGVTALIMCASVVMGLFGLFRVIMGAIQKQ